MEADQLATTDNTLAASAVRGVAPPADQLLNTAEAAELLHTPVATLRWWRHQGTGPRAFKLGARKVMYRRSDVVAWLEQQYAGTDPVA